MSQVETKDALLHAINEEYVEAVEVLLDHEESIHTEGEPWISIICDDGDLINLTAKILIMVVKI